jgi:teichuronic acid biosynthesis glycosyltransferase TuaC
LVITDIGGAREVLRDDKGGRIVERNAASIATAVSELLASPLSREAVAATVADYSWDRKWRRAWSRIGAIGWWA